MKTKKCNTCGKEKPIKRFKKDEKREDGTQSKCYDCYNKRQAELNKQRKGKSEIYFDPKTPAF